MLFDSKIKIGNKYIGDGFPTFITFEAGPTHNSFDSAKQLIKMAADSGADAIKFQILDPERLMADKRQTFEYEYLLNKKTNEIISKKENLYEILKRRSLKMSEWSELKKYSDSLNISFFATIAYEDEIKFVKDIGCESIKIASADVNYLQLIKQAAKTGLSIQLDTGNSTIGEIEKAARIVYETGNKKLIVHHCPTGYPAKLDAVNLRIIKSLKQLFNFPIAFSDHSPGYDMDIAAVCFGANLLEKTITKDKTTPSVEHIMSLEKEEAGIFVQKVRDLEKAFGAPVKILSSKDEKNRTMIRRSPYLKNNESKNTGLKKIDVIFSRPGIGISPEEYEILKMKGKLKRNLKRGNVLKSDDIIV